MPNWTYDDLSNFYDRLKHDGRATRQHVESTMVTRIPVIPHKPKQPRGMNKLESAYAQQLDIDKAAGLIAWWAFEPFSLRLAKGASFKPDFAVLKIVTGCGHCSGMLTLEFHETKGFWREAARVRIKVAASLYPFRFFGIKKIHGKWETEEF